jgi:hypothetical protein
MSAPVKTDHAAHQLEGDVAEYLINELSWGVCLPSGLEVLPADEHEPDAPLLVRYRGQRYELDIQVYANPVAEPLTPEQEAERQAREVQAAIEASMVPLFPAEVSS